MINKMFSGNVKSCTIHGDEYSTDSKWSIECTEWLDEEGVDIFFGESTPISLSKEQLTSMFVGLQLAGIITAEHLDHAETQLKRNHHVCN